MGRTADSLVTLDGRAPLVGKGGGAMGSGDGGVLTEARGYNNGDEMEENAAGG